MTQIQLRIRHFPKRTNFRKEPLLELPCETFETRPGKYYNKFQSNIL